MEKLMNGAFFKYWLLGSILFTLSNKTIGQDIHFSQFFETPILRSPALAGIFNGDIRIQSVYRNQWNSVTVPYQTTSLSAEFKQHVGKGNDFLTIGGALLYDKAGTIALKSIHVLPTLTFHKSLSADRNQYLSAGFSLGFLQRSLDVTKMTTNSQFNGSNYDPALNNGEPLTNNHFFRFDGNVGLSFSSQLGENPDNNIYVGMAYHHFNPSANQSFYNSPDVHLIPKIVISGGLRLSVTDDSFTTYYADYSQQGTSKELIGGMMYSKKLDDPTEPKYIISGGAFVRWKDAFIPVVKLDILPLTFGLSYDVNVSQLKTGSEGRGGFELSISYQKFLDKYNSTRMAVRCPSF